MLFHTKSAFSHWEGTGTLQGAIVPQVAQSVKKVDEFTWEVTLKSGYKFSDGTVVTGKVRLAL